MKPTKAMVYYVAHTQTGDMPLSPDFEENFDHEYFVAPTDGTLRLSPVTDWTTHSLRKQMTSLRGWNRLLNQN
jgi:hypothetical protein